MKNKDVEKRKKELIKELALLYNYNIEKNNAKIPKEEIKEVPLLINLYQEFLQEVYQPSKRYLLALKIKNEINEDIEKTFTEEQQELMNQFKECQDIMINDMNEESFIYGYCMASELREEAIKRYGKADVNKK